MIGQARIDTALFLPPVIPSTPRRGRKRSYGERLTCEMIETLPVLECTLALYGKEQRVRLRAAIVLARFLKATPVHAVWCQFHDPDTDTWSRPQLLLATETALPPQSIVRFYGRRWGIEPLFHNLKRWWGAANLWQQSIPAVELWMQIRSMAWTLAQLFTLVADNAFPVEQVAPWRANQPLTAGMIGQWLRIEFTGVAFRDGFDKKSGKFRFPTPRNDPRVRESAGQAP